MKIYNELESLGFFEWLSKTHNLKDTDMTPECLDKLLLEDIHRTVGNSMAFRWFRDKYNLVHTVYSNASGYIWEIHYNQERGGTHICESGESGDCEMSGMFTTYEKAELECLKKLIEIKKATR